MDHGVAVEGKDAVELPAICPEAGPDRVLVVVAPPHEALGDARRGRPEAVVEDLPCHGVQPAAEPPLQGHGLGDLVGWRCGSADLPCVSACLCVCVCLTALWSLFVFLYASIAAPSFSSRCATPTAWHPAAKPQTGGIQGICLAAVCVFVSPCRSEDG